MCKPGIQPTFRRKSARISSGAEALHNCLIDRRKQREMGTERQRLHKRVKTALPFARRVSASTLARLLIGLLVYTLLLWAHSLLFGVSPLP